MSYHEKCYCPIDSVDEWLDQMSCPSSIRQIKRDLSIFSKMGFKPIAEELVERFGRSPGSMAVSHYVIKNNKVHYSLCIKFLVNPALPVKKRNCSLIVPFIFRSCLKKGFH